MQIEFHRLVVWVLINTYLTTDSPLSQYIREAYEHTERKGHPQFAWKLKETVSIL